MIDSIKFVYFDIDDTLLNHRQAERAGLQDTRSELKELQKVNIEKLWDVYHQINVHLWGRYGRGEISRSYLQKHRFLDTLKELKLDAALQETMAKVYMATYKKHWSWIEGAKEALSEISKRYPTGFLTNGFSEIQRAKRDVFGLDTFSSIYIISEDVGCMKPSACIFDYATGMAQCDPGDILYVGDSYNADIQGGKAFGWKTAWYTNETQNGQFHADIIFNNYENLIKSLLN